MFSVTLYIIDEGRLKKWRSIIFETYTRATRFIRQHKAIDKINFNEESSILDVFYEIQAV